MATGLAAVVAVATETATRTEVEIGIEEVAERAAAEVVEAAEGKAGEETLEWRSRV